MLDLSSTAKAGRKRTEQSVNAYYCLYKDVLQPEIERDFARQDDSVLQIAHRDRFLAQRLKEAPDNIKELVEKSRIKAGSSDQLQVEWADAGSVTEDEIQRRNTALQLTE